MTLSKRDIVIMLFGVLMAITGAMGVAEKQGEFSIGVSAVMVSVTAFLVLLLYIRVWRDGPFRLYGVIVCGYFVFANMLAIVRQGSAPKFIIYEIIFMAALIWPVVVAPWPEPPRKDEP
ncbi:MAG: hypothetical protein U1D30_26160 [Planctomycetota bacterium]